MFRVLSNAAEETPRAKIGRWAASCIGATVKSCQQLGTAKWKRKLISIVRPLDWMIGLYLTTKLYLDILVSELSDICWLVVSSSWVTLRLLQARGYVDIDEMQQQNEWGFGQILPVFLLLGPVVAVVVSINIRSRDTQKPGVVSDLRLAALLAEYRKGITLTPDPEKSLANSQEQK
ncbi:uncharacterized protein CTRU02_202979 [Colletotrichum truncatum]|uniref:Uncharacterized protein n=1 Tax=Colletotrichum truncatum TaxID=5467 RepID=A0ACC3Z800_COLTU